jgi:hypothetical protein
MSPKANAELSRRQKNIARTVAKEAFVEAGGDRSEAERIVRERMQRKMGSVFVAIAIKLAIELILYWLRNRTTEPSAVFQAGEPGADCDEDVEEYGAP